MRALPEARPRERIVLAEDDRDMRELVAWHLTRRGYDVIECNDGAVATHVVDLLAINDAELELIISDLRMPGSSGLELCHAIRDAHPSTPLIVMTAFPHIETRIEASKLHVAGFFAKPFDVEELCSLVDQLVRPRSRS